MIGYFVLILFAFAVGIAFFAIFASPLCEGRFSSEEMYEMFEEELRMRYPENYPDYWEKEVSE